MLVSMEAARRLRRFRKAKPVPPVPVLVVGNITVGGTGKTPLVIALVQAAKARGLTVVVVSRGYGGKTNQYPVTVDAQSAALDVGDEPVLIARRTGAPVILDPDRHNALQVAVRDHHLIWLSVMMAATSPCLAVSRWWWWTVEAWVMAVACRKAAS